MGWAIIVCVTRGRGYPLAARGERHGLATVVDSMGESMHVVFCDFLCLQHPQNKRGKSVPISILACLLGFHAISLERGTFTKIAIIKIKLV